MTSPKQPRFSWKKPWAFNDIHEMRKYITEREVYRKLKILERHSSYKKPYWNFKSHPYGELYYMPPGYNPGYRPGGGNWVPPSGGSGPGTGDCTMACLGGILDCKNGGCATPTCICGEAPYTLEIISDPTGGRAWVEDGINPLVCIPPITLDEEYPELVVLIRDRIGQESLVTFYLVDCEECCESFSLSGDGSVNPGDTWNGTIDPPCPGASAVAVSNSGCTFTATVSASGATVSVPVGDSDCGTFTVTVTSSVKGDCTLYEASAVVVINNTGQGGAWSSTSCRDHSDFQQTETLNSGDSCAVEDADQQYIEYASGIRIANSGSSTQQLRTRCIEWLSGQQACIDVGITYSCPSCDCVDPGGPCSYTVYVTYWVWEWECTC